MAYFAGNSRPQNTPMNRTLINRLIFEHRLALAIELLQAAIDTSSMQRYQPELDELQGYYSTTISFLRQGIMPDDSEDVIRMLQRRLLEISDALYREHQLRSSSAYYYISIKLNIDAQRTGDCIEHLLLLDKEYPDVSDRASYDKLVELFFEQIWTCTKLTAKMAEQIRSSGIYLKCIAATALGFALMQQWDFEKVRFILEELGDRELPAAYHVRLGTTLILACSRYRQRLGLYHEDFSSLCLAASQRNEELKPLLVMLWQSYLVASDAKRLDEQYSSHIAQMFSTDAKKLMDMVEASEEAMNPTQQWKHSTQDGQTSEMQQTLQELIQLDQEGADLTYSVYKTQKFFPFFQHISAWFLPFDRRHSAVNAILENNHVMANMLPLLANKLCHSDTYSLVLNNFGGGYMQEKLSQHPEILDNIISHTSLTDIGQLEERDQETEATAYMRSLFRFFTLFPQRESYFNPFTPLLPPYQPLFLHFQLAESSLSSTLSFLHTRGRHAEITTLLQWYEKENKLNRESTLYYADALFQAGQYQEVIRIYRHFVTPSPSSISQLDLHHGIQLGLAYRQNKELYTALEIFEKLYAQFPDHHNLLLRMAATNIELHDYRQAKSQLYEYIVHTDDKKRVARALAWTHTALEEMEEALEIYRKTICSDDWKDCLNEAYVHGYLNHWDEAYATLLRGCPNGANTSVMLETIREDKYMLDHIGVPTTMLQMMVDSFRIPPEKTDETH